MKLYVAVIVAALSSFALSACGGGTTAGGMAAMPAAQALRPLINKVMVTAVFGKAPIPHLEITLTRNTWPNGKLIAKGKTGMRGRVTLSGNWTRQDRICVGGKYRFRDGYSESRRCEQPFPPAIALQFAPPTPPPTAGR